VTPDGLERLKIDEGLRLQAYPDPRSGGDPWTIGYGCTGPGIHEGVTWTKEQADAEIVLRVERLENQFQALAWWSHVDPVRRDVLVNIAYNVGFEGLMHWPKTLGHFAAGEYEQASHDLLFEGAWDKEVGGRALRLSQVTASGFWPQGE
jgi:lysozyme